MKAQLLSAIAAVALGTLGAATAFAQGTPEPTPAYKCVPTAASTDGGPPNMETSCPKPTRNLFDEAWHMLNGRPSSEAGSAPATAAAPPQQPPG